MVLSAAVCFATSLGLILRFISKAQPQPPITTQTDCIY